ncbi:U3 small nucleolar RNA-associated protein 25 isoform X2 [Phoenix dactylifera]|uniref:U3 small nucleolar RNA-associated protein 25 isoform X2 n=2 Tax=Phoenix dactylifera TaxID=42345 RepID=A0A8B9AIV7_PHODC|nr:U3 small nucleolar RNA-associated protein 25 isoform X2 [Phoenix dactylifera]
MMGKSLAEKKGLKKLKTRETIKTVKQPIKRPFNDKPEMTKAAKKPRKKSDDKVANDSLLTSGHSLKELSNSVNQEEDIFREPSVFDNLLKALGSGSEKLATLYKKRQLEQEGRSDSEEDKIATFESASLSEEEDVGTGSVSESSLGDAEEDDLGEHGPADMLEQTEEDETGDEDGNSDAGDSQDLEISGQTILDEPESTSSFHRHLGHILTNEEVDELMKNKWKFKWELPAISMPVSRWAGTGDQVSMETNSDQNYGLMQKLYNHWLDIYKTSGFSDFDTSRQRFFFSLCSSYRDILHCNKKPFYLKGNEEDSSIMDAYIMHALNHVYKTRDLVIKSDAKLAKHQEGNKEEVLRGGTFLDQGFTRPKVMFILPLGSIALRVVKRLIQLTPISNKANVEHMDRFSEEFGTGDVEDDDEQKDGSSKSQKPAKPADFQILFGGNNNDHFMLGIKFTKRSIKLYSDFYSSDIIVASPLGLITKIGEAEVEKEKDVDYLSSIEVLIIDHADVITMQNWSHVNTLVEQLNRMPFNQHGTDVMRIRPWYLDGHAHFYRQTILLGSFLNPDMNALFNRLCVNHAGKVKSMTEYKGVLPKILLEVRQVYERFDAPSIAEADDARLDYFCKKVFPKIKDSIEGGIMLFISSYFEFVRIRNFLKSQNASFCLLGEYTKQSDISRARVWFFEGKRKIMLYTERAHFYHRYKIRGIQNLIIYSLPERKEFYPEIINMLDGSKNMMCNVLFSRFDHLRLERIVGTSAAKRMLSSDKNIFVFT